MDTAVYFANDEIQIVTGSQKGDHLTIKKATTVKLQEGVLINGVITDPDAMEKVLWQLKKDKQFEGNVRIVIDSANIITKRCVVPFMDKGKLLKFTQDEFSNLGDTYQELIYDYTVIQQRNGGEGSGTILCCAVERSLLDRYITIFQRIGVKIQKIDIALNCFLKVLSKIPALRNRTYIYSIVDGNNIISALFVNNSYVFSTRNKILDQRGTQDFVNEILSKLSTLIQFNKSEQNHQDIEVAYFSGLEPNEMTLCNSLASGLRIAISGIPHNQLIVGLENRGFDLSHYMFACGCLLDR